MNLSITFEENPNEYNTSGDYAIDLETTFSGQTTNYQWITQGFIGAGVWDRSGDLITITTDTGETSTATVVSETSSELVLGYDVMQTQTQQGVTSQFDVQGTYTFERQERKSIHYLVKVGALNIRVPAFYIKKGLTLF